MTALPEDSDHLDDAVRPDPDASYASAAAAEVVSDAEVEVIEQQLGRPSRGRSAVVHRCERGLPTVLRVDPRLEDGTPFPTTFWSCCPVLNSALGTAEGEGGLAGINERLEQDAEASEAYTAAQFRLVAFREELGDGDVLPGNPTAGGQPGHVKCLHTAVAHHLATGDNVVGGWALEQVRPVACPRPCVESEAS